MKKRTARLRLSIQNIFLLLISFSISSACHKKVTTQERIVDYQYKKAIIEGQKSAIEFLMMSLVPGFSIAVSVDGNMVWSEGIGEASKELGAKVSRHTKFRIGTSTQMFTAYLIALLQQKGKLNVDSSFYNYIPAFPEKEYDFTPRMLGTFSAGFPDVRIERLVKNDSITSLKSYIHYFAEDKLVYKPQTYFVKSDYSIALLGIIAEQLTSKPYVKLVREMILDTLKLTGTTFDFRPSIIENRSQFYDNDYIARLIDAPEVDLMPFAPAHGILSTAEDLNKAAQLVLSPRFFTNKSLELFSEQNTIEGKPTSRAFGWWIGQDNKQRKIMAQFGNTIGGSSSVVVYPDQKLVVTVCANKGSDVDELPANEIAQIFLKYIDAKE